MVRKAKDRVESELAVSFCQGIDKSFEVAESGRDFSKDTAALLQSILDGNTEQFSAVMAEKCRDIEEGHQAILQVRTHFQAVRRAEAQV
jgi:CII-binding regulator of phage lambda lysogenization HflD